MSANKHHTNSLQNPSMNYVEETIGPFIKCPKRSCQGCLVSVLVRYEGNNYVSCEQECTACGKVVRDRVFKKDNKKNKNFYWSASSAEGNNK